MNPLYTAAVYFVWFLSTYFIVFFFLVLFLGKQRLYEGRAFTTKRRPWVTVIVPAYNEEATIAETIRSLKKVIYKRVKFIIVNDGSTDQTSSVVRRHIKGNAQFTFIDRQENRGKAASLNEGIARSRTELVAGIDADSVIEPNIFEKALPYFEDPTTGAVTVSVQVKKMNKFLDRIVDLEFIIGLSLFLKVFSFLNCVFVTPGPFSLYRRSLLKKIGGFDTENLTEDLEIAYRIHKAGYKIANCLEAKVYTIVPPTFKAIYIQRRRWYSGAIQTLIKHKNVLFNRKLGMFGLFIPFNYALVLFGMLLFFASTYVFTSQVAEYAWNLQYTGFNIIENLRHFEFDFLRMGRVSLVGLSAFLMTFVILFLGLKFTRQKYGEKRLGILGYPLLFFLYQIYWAGAVLSVVRGKKVKWR